MKHQFSSQKGFTLVELIVSLGLFTIVVVSVVSSLYTVNTAYRRVSAMRETLDNLNFAIESMVRTIHTGSEIVCGDIRPLQTPGQPGTGKNCVVGTQGASRISLKSTLGKRELIQYSLENQKIMRQVAPITCSAGTFGEECSIGGFDTKVELTAPEIKVDQLTFFVEGAERSDGEQPRVILQIKGIAHAVGSNANDTGALLPFYLQTYISQRSFESL